MFKRTLLASISWSGQLEKKQVRSNFFELFRAEMIKVGEEFVKYWTQLQKVLHFQKKMRLPRTIIGKTNIYESFVKNTILLKLTFSLIDGTDCSYSLCWWRSQGWALLTWLLRVGWVGLPRVGRRHPVVNSKALPCNLQCRGGSPKENSNLQNRDVTWPHSISHTWRSSCSLSASHHNYFF